MTTGPASVSSTSSGTLRTAVIWAGIPFVLGVSLGILYRRIEVSRPAKPDNAAAPQAAAPRSEAPAASPEQIRILADKEAEPLLAQLKTTPNDPELLAKVGNIYYVTRNFQEACNYFQRSVDIKDDATLRTELGRAYFYAGSPDEALAQFEKVLKKDPDNANAMFNLGMVKWQSKFDVEGALAAWEQILRKHPEHPRRAEVEKLIARAKQHRDMKPSSE